MPISIDPRFLDVDFRKTTMPTGNLGRNESEAFAAPVFEDSIKLVPRNEWRDACDELDHSETGIEWLVSRIMNQGQEGSCVANACSQANQIVQAIQYGKHAVVQLSAISLYKRIGRSPGSGAMVDDGLSEMRGRGILPLDNDQNKARFKHTMPHTGFYTRWPEGWEETARLFKGDEWLEIRSLDGLVSAQLLGYPVVVGRQGHSICYVRPFYNGGRLYNLYANSWGNWGQGAGEFRAGFGVDSQSQMGMSSGWAFALRSVVVPQEQLGEL